MNVFRSLFIIPAMLFAGFSCASVQENTAMFPVDEIAEGDLAFRCGRGMFSHVVTFSEEKGLYSHVGLVVRDRDSSWKVVHAVPDEREFKGDFDRVKMEDIAVFFSSQRARRGCLLHTGISDTTLLGAICRNAKKAAQDSLGFDNDYDLEDSSKVYCTEFVWRLFRREGIDLSEGRRRFTRIVRINGDVLLPEHLLDHCGNNIYFTF